MERHRWDPVCERPRDLSWPVRLDPTGQRGPTRGQARGKAWRRVAHGWYVPSTTGESVEQRIIEQGCRLREDTATGCVTGWAALRWRGATFFDGLGPGGEGAVPVELGVRVCDHDLAPSPACIINRRALAPADRCVVDGLPVTTVQRAVFDEIVRRGELWQAVSVIDMAAAAGLISAWVFATYAGLCNSMNGVPLVRDAVSLAVDESRSPRETWMRLVWKLVAGFGEPLVNQPVYDLQGRKVGTPDLLDVEAGVAVEYNGEDHKGIARARIDVERDAGFRRVGIETISVVRGQSREVVAGLMREGRSRGAFLSADDRLWTVERPAHLPPVETLDQRLERLGLVPGLVCGRISA